MIKIVLQISDKSVWNKKYEKYEIVYIEWKELNIFVLGKGPFQMRKTESKISGQELHCLTKVQLGNQEWHVKVESSIIRSCFEHIWFKLRKKMFFWQGYFLRKHPISGHYIFLKWDLTIYKMIYVYRKILRKYVTLIFVVF